MMAPPVILVADAQADVSTKVRASLEECGFRALPAITADAIWQAMDDEPLGAVVLDTALPGMPGTDLCRAVRERSDVPIILVGANSTEIDRVVGLELGADDFLDKPYSPRELIARLRAVLRRGRSTPAVGIGQRQEARFEGWTVSFSRREVTTAGGDLVALTSAEFDLLAALMEQAQRVVARERLIDLAGARGGGSSDRSVDVLISRLRRKLQDGGMSAPIVTVRGIGYMFSAPVDYG